MKSCYFDYRTCTIADLVGPDTEGVWLIMRINVPERLRGRGHGSTLLKQILEDADREGVTLELWPIASGAKAGGLSQDQLVSWYERYGFTRQTNNSMKRSPRD